MDPEYDVLPEEDIDLIEEFVPVPLFMDRPTRNVPLKRLFLLHTIKGAFVGSQEHLDATKQLDDIISKRRQEEHNIDHMKKSLFGQPFRNQTCFNSLMGIYEKICGHLSPYVSKHERDIADLCDAGVTASQMAEASVQTCQLN
ncbi:hypothetical protein TIFTF001_008346 [Ficus carica]|uniref:Legumain prodomain domain-containing protein n=1 Tax=Ficus carica TaxID=3494 RepID=A0AA87ZT50_FICCA|nr:hypothetical protein TIFTF001_008346 [Ficus carica]